MVERVDIEAVEEKIRILENRWVIIYLLPLFLLSFSCSEKGVNKSEPKLQVEKILEIRIFVDTVINFTNAGHLNLIKQEGYESGKIQDPITNYIILIKNGKSDTIKIGTVFEDDIKVLSIHDSKAIIEHYSSSVGTYRIIIVDANKEMFFATSFFDETFILLEETINFEEQTVLFKIEEDSTILAEFEILDDFD